MKLCDRCIVPGCCLDYLGTACAKARKKYCPDVCCNNAERIADMSYDELADFLVSVSDGLLSGKSAASVKRWLEEPYEPS